MKTRVLIIGSLLLVLVGLSVFAWLPRGSNVTAASRVFASPIHGGCYITATNQCKIHVEPFTIQVNSGASLKFFQVLANGKLLYDFKPDASNPPIGDFTPSQVALDFAAACGQTYKLTLVGRDSVDTNPYTLGQTDQFICPTTIP